MHGSVQTSADLAVVEGSGTIKWFDNTKGYGFIKPNQEGVDVLLHVTVLRKSGFQTVLEGARVVYEAIPREKGLQCAKIVSMDDSGCIPPAPPVRNSCATPPEIKDIGDFEEATVSWFNRLRGFGFINKEGVAQDIFVHMEVVRRASMLSLLPGQKLEVRHGTGPKGLMAAEIRPCS